MGAYWKRIKRDGWVRKKRDLADNSKVAVFEKPMTDYWILRKLTKMGFKKEPGKSFYWDDHELRNVKTGTIIKLPKWRWADYRDNRVLWATDGKLFAATISGGGLSDKKELHDFNDMKFKAIPAPYDVNRSRDPFEALD